MAFTTTEIVLVLLLGVGLIIAIWVYAVSHKENAVVSAHKYTRGANLSKAGSVLLTCDPGTVISWTTATMVCHDPTSDNFENPTTDPWLTDGTPNPATTVDLKDDIKKCEGQTQCTYDFKGTNDNFVCGPNGTAQLIATYTCSPPDSLPTSSDPSN